MNINIEILNRIANGNTMAMMMNQERESGVSVQDRYLCTECGCLAYESNWVANNNVCLDCFND